MARGKTKPRLGSNFTLGGEQAEADPLLQDAFYESEDYAAVKSRADPRCFLIARTGSGKSALLQRLEEEEPAHVIRVNPEDLSLPYITDLGAIRYLDSLDVHLDPLFIALWKHIFVVEIIRHRYKVDSPEAKQNFLSGLIQRIGRNPTKRAALEYLDEFQGKYWAETDVRVREITQHFQDQVDAEAKVRFGMPHVGTAAAGISSSTDFTADVRAEQAERFQRIVNETQLARLNKMISVLDEDILDSPQNFTYLVIDDLDRDWVDERLVNGLLRCLFRAVLDLKRVRQLKVLVALRTNIFDQLDFGRRSGGQEEKFRALVLKMRWGFEELKELLNERARVAAAASGFDNINTVDDLLPRPTRTRGNPVVFILNHTLMRPRDGIAFLNEALGMGLGKTRLTWNHLIDAMPGYSRNRLLGLRDEWKLSYPGIEAALGLFSNAQVPMSKMEFTKVLDDAMLLPGGSLVRGRPVDDRPIGFDVAGRFC